MYILREIRTSFLAALFIVITLAGCSQGSQDPETTPFVAAADTLEVMPAMTVDSILPEPDSSLTPSSYPGPAVDNRPTSTPQPLPYPAPTGGTVSAVEPESAGATASAEVYMPVAGGSSNVETATAIPAEPTQSPSPTPVPTVDFAAVQADLRAAGQELGFVKIGFHVTLPEDRDILDGWMTQLDAAGVPLFIKAVDNAEPLYRAQELMKASGVPHTLVYRSTGSEPLYHVPAEQAAQVHWQEHRDRFPPELDPSLVWIETLNEPDRTKAEWLGQFALEVARLAEADGFKWAAFSWASGEPEPEQWQTPSMLAFLQLAAQNPDRLAIALHEYSFLKEDLGHQYPFKVGRFQELFRIADQRGFPRPTVLITEWGWEHNNIPDPQQAMRDIDWAAKLYAPFPEVKGAGIWNLGVGCCFGDVSEQVQEIIDPLTKYSLTNYFEIPQPPAQQPIDPQQFSP